MASYQKQNFLFDSLSVHYPTNRCGYDFFRKKIMCDNFKLFVQQLIEITKPHEISMQILKKIHIDKESSFFSSVV